jgi:hypothetical protein
MQATTALSEGFEDVPEAEWQRFLAARDGEQEEASEMLREHLAWRAASLPLADGSPTLGSGLPAMLVFGEGERRALSGTRVAVFLAAMYDPKLADDDAYTRAIAATLDANLDRAAAEKITLLVDVRGGDGWANPAATSVIPFLRTLSSVLSANFPERLHQLIVFPVPWIASTLWSVIKQFLDANTARKVVLLDGPADRKAPLPPTLAEYVDESTLAMLHRIRTKALMGTGA